MATTGSATESVPPEPAASASDLSGPTASASNLPEPAASASDPPEPTASASDLYEPTTPSPGTGPRPGTPNEPSSDPRSGLPDDPPNDPSNDSPAESPRESARFIRSDSVIHAAGSDLVTRREHLLGARRQRGDPGPGGTRGRQPGDQIRGVDGRAAAVVPLAAGPATLLGDPGRPGRHLRVRGVGTIPWHRVPDHRGGVRYRTPRPGAGGLVAAHRRTGPDRHPGRRGGPAGAGRRRDGTDRPAGFPVALQPGGGVRRCVGLRRSRRDPRRLGRQGRGGGRRRHRPRRGFRLAVVPSGRAGLGPHRRHPGDRRHGAGRRPRGHGRRGRGMGGLRRPGGDGRRARRPTGGRAGRQRRTRRGDRRTLR